MRQREERGYTWSLEKPCAAAAATICSERTNKTVE